MKQVVAAAFAASIFWLAAERSATTAIAALAFSLVYWGLRIEDDIKARSSREDKE